MKNLFSFNLLFIFFLIFVVDKAYTQIGPSTNEGILIRENAALQREVRRLTNELEKANAENKRLNDQINRLNSEKNKTISDFSTSISFEDKNKIQRLENMLKQLSLENKTLLDKLEDAHKEKEILSSRIVNLNLRIADLNKASSTDQSVINNLRKEQQVLQTDRDNLNRRTIQLESELRSLNQKFDEPQKLIKELKQSRRKNNPFIAIDGFGIKGGLNLSNISNKAIDFDFSPSIKTGLNAGVFVNMRFGNKESVLGLQPELLFSQHGFVINGNAINFNYITVPLMVKFNLGRYSYSGNFYLETGPFFSYLLTVTPNSMALIEEYDFNSKTVDFNLLDLKNGKDIGAAIGAGYEFKFGLIIGARYSHGLSDMAKNLQWKNNVIAVSAGWKF